MIPESEMSVRVVPFIGCRSLSFPLATENIKSKDKVLGIVSDTPCITETDLIYGELAAKWRTRKQALKKWPVDGNCRFKIAFVSAIKPLNNWTFCLVVYASNRKFNSQIQILTKVGKF